MNLILADTIYKNKIKIPHELLDHKGQKIGLIIFAFDQQKRLYCIH